MNLPAAAKTILPLRRPPVTAGDRIALRDVIGLRSVTVLVRALLSALAFKRPCAASHWRPPREAASCFARGSARAPFFLAMAPGISIPCELRLACESPKTRAAGKTEAGMESVRRRLRHDELAFSSVCLRARSGLAQATRGGDGLLGRRSRGAARAIPRPYERRFEHRAVS